VSRTIRELVEERSAEIVGRNAEKAALLGTLEEGGQLVVFVHGIAGVGKSTLLEAFAGDARGVGATVVRIDCRSIEPTERGFLDGLRGAVGGAPTSAEEAAERLGRLGERVVLVLDTYEVLRLLDSWIRQVFAPALRDNTRLVVAGREPPVATWCATPGWSELVLSVPLGNLDDSAAVRARPAAELEDIALQAVLDELTGLYLDVLAPPTREALDAASVVRRITLSLLEAMLPDRAPQDAFERLRALPVVRLGHDGLIVHDTVRETVARALRGSDPATHRRYRGAAWRRLQNELPTVPPAELWRYTADMLYLIENPVVREAFFPTTEHAYWVEAATPADASAIEAIARRHEPAAAADHLLSWWEHAPQGFRVVRDREGGVAGFSMLFEPDQVSYGAIEADPVTRTWREHLRRDPVPRGQRVLFNRRLLSEEEGERLSGVQAACWLDVKRVYMELRPQLRRIYTTVCDIASFAPIVTPLGFVPMPDVVQLDNVGYHSAFLDFGPSSVDGWLAKLVARELLIQEDSILDRVERQLVLDGRRVDLTRLEFEVLDYLLQHEGKVVERGSLLRDVWGSAHVGSNVVDAVIRTLRKKLGERSVAIETVRSIGYRFRDEVASG
jgi:DNA-binding winged helix-turn-helix (wHTH) protein